MVRAPEVWAWGTANQEAWSWNGLPLQSAYGAWNLGTMGGSRFSVPVFRGQDYQVPYRAGMNWRAKLPDSRTITLAMWADGQGLHSTSAYPAADQRLAFNSNVQQLRQAFFQMTAQGSAQGQLQRNWYIQQLGSPVLVQSTAMAELAGSMDLTMNGRTNAGFSVDLLLSDPWFYGTQESHAASGGSTAVTNKGDGVVGLGFASAVSSFTVTCTAACTVNNTTAGVTFTLGSGPAYPVVVDILNGTVTDNGGNNWIGALTHLGARAWMALPPGSNIISVSSGTATFVFNPPYN